MTNPEFSFNPEEVQKEVQHGEEKSHLEHVSINNLFDDVRRAAEMDGGMVKGSKREYSPETIIEDIKSLIQCDFEIDGDAPIVGRITRAHNIRDKFVEVLNYHNDLIKEMQKPNPDIFSQCKSIDEVKEVIFTLGKPLEGSNNQYTYEELEKRLDAVDRIQIPIASLTRTAGLRDAVKRIKGVPEDY